MKKLYSLLLTTSVIMFSQINFGQTYCGSDRYDKEVFANFVKTPDITYGSSIPFGSSTPQTQKLDVYQPSGDSITARPLIIWAHGGSFIGGSKADPDVVSLSQTFAKKGYVTASINYRLYYYPLDNATQAKKAVMRAVQDLKAAVRFFRKDAYTANTYKVDTNKIFVGGSSAGALTALHLAYLDTDAEFAAEIDTSGLGGLEGNSGNPGYLSTVHGVINLCGALGNANYLDNGTNEPLVSLHGTNDGTVPYATAPIPQVPSLIVDGSHSIHVKANSTGLANSMFTYFGAGHCPYVGTSSAALAYMDTTVRFVSNFLYEILGCIPSDPNPLQNTFSVSVKENSVVDNFFSVYPNPSSGEFFIALKNVNDFQNAKFILYDVFGKEILNEKISSRNFKINAGKISNGVYLYKIENNKSEIGKGKLIKE